MGFIMRLGRYLSKSRIIELQSSNFSDALLELLQTCRVFDTPEENTSIIDEIIEREKTITSYLGNGVAMPYVRHPISKPYIFALGRCKNGLSSTNSGEHKDTRLVFLMIISTQNEESYLTVLASIARVFQNQDNINLIFKDQSIATFRRNIRYLFGTCKSPISMDKSSTNHLMLREAQKIARFNQCAAILIFGDVLTGPFEITEKLRGIRFCLVAHKTDSVGAMDSIFDDIIYVHPFSNYRLSQARSAIIIALTRGILNYKDKICCFSGLPKSNIFDTISIVDIAKEFGNSFSDNESLIKEGIQPEALERLLAIAADISVEGREGKSVGCLFVIGNITKIKPFTKPLVLNPFYGYKEEDRNILNPFMVETIKEFSSIDGAFIVRGDGVIESAGSMIQASSERAIQMPSGFGTRHAAGAAISAVANCIAIAVSESTHQVTLFKDGKMMLFADQSFSSSTI
ncbi:MAG: diadenylate cyclase [Puniceicoccales bacterium]|jgi:DNA integrity scanning protein DisA with diadenylate cyclase activity/mannitol/fructose-specific phosphotransferase system IIA component (Ntr-type)|nr:diadenylate cyclase [Puniceicoccales bacterium]